MVGGVSFIYEFLSILLLLDPDSREPFHANSEHCRRARHGYCVVQSWFCNLSWSKFRVKMEKNILFDTQVEGSHEEDSEDEEFAELMARYDKVFYVFAQSLARNKTVLRIRIRLFSGLPDPLVRGSDPRMFVSRE